MNQKVVRSKASTVVASLAGVAHSSESGQGDDATLAGGEKENLIPPMLLAGLTTTATKSKKNARTLADTKLEMEVISQCGSGGLDDYKPSRTNMARMARMKLEGQLVVVEYSRITVPDSVHMGDPAGGYVEMLTGRKSMQEYLKELTDNSNLSRKEYGTVMSSEANEIGLERLLDYLCFLVTKATDREHVDPESLVLALTRLRDFLVERGVTSLSLPVYDPNRGKLHPRKLYAQVHVIFSETDIKVYLHKKYYLIICYELHSAISGFF